MGQKVHRKRRTFYSRRRSPWGQVLGWVLAALILIPGSFFAAKLLAGKKADVPAAQTGVTTGTTTAAGDTTTSTTTAPPIVTEQTVFRGFVIPYTALKDVEALKQTAANAAAAGFNCAVIELKNKDGGVCYISNTEASKTAGAAVEDALSLSALTDAFATMREAGISPIPLLYAFEDTVASRNIPGAKVTVEGHADWTWYDGDPQNGGRPWLNPYADAAQAYIVGLAEELRIAGAGAIMLDGVYFPTQTSQADFTAVGDATLSKGEVLAQFMTRMDTLCEIPILLRCSANAALGNNTAGYHANPLSLGATMVVADTRVSALGEKIATGEEMLPVSETAMSDILSRITDVLGARVEAQPTEKRPATAVSISGSTASTQINAVCAKNANTSYFVYNESGTYDFAALSHTTE